MDTVQDRHRTYRGHLFHIAGSPHSAAVDAHVVSERDGAIAVDRQGRIEWVGPWGRAPRHVIERPVARAAFLLPGFVDTHVHYPQVYSTDAYGGGQLLEWLDSCIFPAEARFKDEAFARQAAADFTARRLAVGTTSAMVFGSAFPHAQDALYEQSLAAGLRTVSGRGVQVLGPPSASMLLTDEEEALSLVAAEIDRWHGTDPEQRPAHEAMIQTAIVPRFSLSTTPRTLAGLGELFTGHRDRGVYVHTHLSENDRPGDGECAAVRAAYGVEHYLDTYDGLFLPGSRRGGDSLLGRRTIMAHAVHCADVELRRLADAGASIAHCPVSQQFLGSGTMPWRRTTASGVTVAMGTDVGAGDEWLMSRVLASAYGVHLSEPAGASVALTPGELLFAATLAGARALDQERLTGNFDIGKEADLLLIEPTEALAGAIEFGVRADEEDRAHRQLLFTLLMGLRESAIRGVVVRGRVVRGS
ncbi:guanine deaminase [Aeromicrobium sp. PE09-221]|uniref:amidohydrolase family protein n=1 Tax=Aeromicrobium sp. PE09-221 TaxID=1898043 RepID=UPI000B3E67F0|nr:amidohydrolase family protein [Aeromicrobium sp. PE09-221]OUZ08015.1 guanine deaminase [Aeromicrobium sp. PE09-221]